MFPWDTVSEGVFSKLNTTLIFLGTQLYDLTHKFLPVSVGKSEHDWCTVYF